MKELKLLNACLSFPCSYDGCWKWSIDGSVEVEHHLVVDTSGKLDSIGDEVVKRLKALSLDFNGQGRQIISHRPHDSLLEALKGQGAPRV